MHEYVSVSVSSYDPSALATKLSEKSADGWEVVAIVPTGGDVTAFLRKASSGAAPAASPTATGAATGASPAATEAAIPAAPATVITDTSGGIVQPSEPQPTPQPPSYEPAPSPEPSPVTEPAGWGSAPEPTPTTPATDAVAESAAAAATREPYAPSANQPAPETATQPAAVSTTPAGWYHDPSGRFELRYWDGNQWTEHVARGGQQFTDPPVA
jgi:hypothetical protein